MDIATESPPDAGKVSRGRPVGAPIARLDHVGFAYDTGTPVLEDIDFEIRKGEFVSFVGPSGCGKSTILRLLGGLSAPTEGAVQVGFDVDDRKQQPISVVFQDATLLPWRSAVANVALPLQLRGVDKKTRESVAREALATVGLAGREKDLPRQLSGGMRMRVAIARALVVEPELLLMDEPFGALDEMTRHRLQEELLRIWEAAGCTIAFVTHGVNEAVFLSTRIALMHAHPGRIADVFDVDLDYPRTSELRTAPEFNQMVSTVSHALHAGEGEIDVAE